MAGATERASDDDRERAVATLREHLVDGRLTLEEFSDRVGTALAARTRGELASVSSDLPPPPVIATGRERRMAMTAAVFAHVVRRGRMRLPHRAAAVAIFADLDLDLRSATVDDDESVVTAVALFGNIDVYVPDGVNVTVTGLTVFGHRREWGFDAGRADAPTLRIHVVGVFAAVDVWSVPRDVGGDYGQVLRAVRELHRSGRRQLPAGG